MSRSWNIGRGCVAAGLLGALMLVGSTAATARSRSISGGEIFRAPPTTAATESSLTGTIVYDRRVPFTLRDAGGTVICRGDLQTRAVQSTAADVLDFYYRFRNTSGPGEIYGIYLSNFVGPLRVGYRTDGLGTVRPLEVYREDWPSTRVLFNFVPPGPYLSCATHDESRFILIRTRATGFEDGGGTAEIIGAIPDTYGTSVSVGIVDPGR